MQISENEIPNEWTREILGYYRGLSERSSQETIVGILRELQDAHGRISPHVLEQAAGTAGMRNSIVQATYKRYPSLRTTPYSHEIILCARRNYTAKDGLTIMDGLRKRLRAGRNNTSEDGIVHLKTRNCLKDCRRTSNVMVDRCIYSDPDAEAILRELGHR